MEPKNVEQTSAAKPGRAGLVPPHSPPKDLPPLPGLPTPPAFETAWPPMAEEPPDADAHILPTPSLSEQGAIFASDGVDLMPARAISIKVPVDGTGPRTVRQHPAEDGGNCVSWTVDARKLTSRDRVAVSPQFKIPRVAGSIKMMIFPKQGGRNFLGAKGMGFVHVKSEGIRSGEGDPVRTFDLCVSVGGTQRDSLVHDFEQNAVCALPRQQSGWDFTQAVDAATQTFVITLEVRPSTLMRLPRPLSSSLLDPRKAPLGLEAENYLRGAGAAALGGEPAYAVAHVASPEPSAAGHQAGSAAKRARSSSPDSRTGMAAKAVPPACAAEPAPPALLGSLTVHRDTVDGVKTRICWTADARKLKGSNVVVVSPEFELPGAAGPFKMMLSPRVSSTAWGGASFRGSRGVGFVYVKSEAGVSEVATSKLQLRVSVCQRRGDCSSADMVEGPLAHDFLESGVCVVPRSPEGWNFTEAVDEMSQTLVVVLEVLPASG